MPDTRSPIEMVIGMPAVAAPGEIDAGNAGWSLAGALSEHGRVGTRRRESSRRCLGWATLPAEVGLR